MRSFSKKLAFALAAAMVLVTAAPAAQAKAADDFSLNRTAQTLYVNKGVNDKGVVEGLTGNVQKYDFNLKNKPADWKDYGYKWSSSNDKVAKVVSGGVTTAVGVGTATITCVITDKATGKTASTLTAKVTVKANAKDVVISNAAAVDGQVVDLENNVVDLNRTLVDENGNKSASKGKYVTDLTKWVAEPAEGVEINQTNGQFTFTEAAAAGEYKLYCYTYQSAKYTQPTATAEPVVVEFVKTNEFTVKQNSTTKFTVNFDAPVSSLAVADVTVLRMLATSAGSYEYPQVVKGVKLADDKMSATVEVFNSFVDKVDYVIKVKDFEDYTMTASVGKPVRMDVVALDGNGNVLNPSFLLTTNVQAELKAIFYDAADVDVTPTVTERVRFTLDKAQSTKDCYLSGSKLTIKKNTASAVVVASYPGWIESGKRVGDFEQVQAFFAEDAAPILPVAVTDFAIGGFQSWGAPKDMQVKDAGKVLEVKLQQSNNDKGWVVYTQGDDFQGDTNLDITFTAMDPDVAVINATTGVVTAFKPGVASFYVNYKYYDKNAKQNVVVPFDVISIEVKANSYFSYVTADNAAAKVGTHPSYHTTAVYVLGFDQYDQRANFGSTANFKIECLSEGYGSQEALASVLDLRYVDNYNYSNADAVAIDVDSLLLREKLVAANVMTAADNGEFVDLEFKATYTVNNSEKTVEFTVTIQEPSGNPDDNLIEVVPSHGEIDVLRKNEWNQNGAKTINFKVNWMNNDVQVGVQAVAKYNADAVSDGAYQYKILKDGQDVTNNALVTAGAGSYQVVVAPSYINPFANRVNNNVVSGGAVAYDGFGAGVYTFELYKWTKDGNEWIDTIEATSEIVVTLGDAGQYTLDTENQKKNEVTVADATGDEYSKADALKILKCFTIIDRNGNAVLNGDGSFNGNIKFAENFFVDYSAPANSDYVYVKEIVFYENVGTNEYVAYVVPVDVSLDRK